jgi:hypothetical protein
MNASVHRQADRQQNDPLNAAPTHIAGLVRKKRPHHTIE